MTNEISYDNPWLYNDEPFDSDQIGDNVGFVYLITRYDGMKYIGQKKFWMPKYRMVNKKKKRYKAESDWKDYYGSSDELKKSVKELGTHLFLREILYLCISKGNMNYLELKEQIVNDVLLKPEEYFNSYVGSRIHRKHILKKCD